MAAWTFREREKKNKVLSFSILFLIFTLTRITEKELGRRISLEEKHENSIAAVRKLEMLAARAQLLEAWLALTSV